MNRTMPHTNGQHHVRSNARPQTSPRVLFVDHTGVLGGAELSLLDIAAHFGEASSVVLFEDGPFRERLEARNLRVHRIGASGSLRGISRSSGLAGDLRALPQLLRLAWRLRRIAHSHDLLYANSQKSMIVAALAAALARKPLVWHLRDLMTSEHFSTTHQQIAVRMANVAVTSVIANSEATRDAFVRAGGNPSKVRVIHNGIAPDPFDDVSEASAAALRTSLGLAAVPVVGSFSRIAPWKGQDVLIRALQTVPDVHALLVGESLFDADHEYEQHLHDLARELDVQDRVHFLGFRNDVPTLMKACDVVAHTSVSAEPFGRVIVEGMLAHRPVVATRAGGACEILSNERTGLLVPPKDPVALSRALSYLVGNPSLSRALADRGSAFARNHFTVDTMLDSIEEHLDTLLAVETVGDPTSSLPQRPSSS